MNVRNIDINLQNILESTVFLPLKDKKIRNES
jgi:hypothetical protein